MLSENISFAEKFLVEAFSEYEGNGTRYEPTDRQALIDIINELHELRTRLTLFMANLPYLDHRPMRHCCSSFFSLSFASSALGAFSTFLFISMALLPS